VDVCVFGGTSAGVIAACTAKRMGKSVLLINPVRHLGGLTSGGLGQTDIGNKYAITGIAREFYRRIGKHYGKFEQWTFEPHVAEETFRELLIEATVNVLLSHQLIAVKKNGTSITEIEIENIDEPSVAKIISASMFIDCTYEGDLMAMAGVSYTIGRESNQTYQERWNGVQLLDKHQFPDGVDPYVVPGKPESGLLWGISQNQLIPNGIGDKNVQAYNFRLCLTNNAANKIPISKPERYDSTIFELLLRQLKAHTPDSLNWQLLHIASMPNQKTDINNCGGFSSDMIGMSYDYVEASPLKRAEIIKTHELYTRSWLYFLGNDKRVPIHLRNEMMAWGYPKDEYIDHQNFSPQLYIREARRMIGPYVMTQHNCEGREIIKDGIGMAAYTMDSHNCQRIVVDGMVKNEGDVQVGGFGPYPISYRAMTPKSSECGNLLVPVCLSASHIAYGSIRMEPVFMVLAQSAAMSASMAIDGKSNVQGIDIAVLQDIIKSNPLADGSKPEILIDNENKMATRTTGVWKRDEKLHHRYGPSVDFTDDINASLRVTVPPGAKEGRYTVYMFCPPLNGMSGLDISLDFGRKKNLSIQPSHHRDQWVSLGKVRINRKGVNTIVITSRKGEKGYLFNDAILFVPQD